ncbi:MAG TPA: hypothetical protein P5181_09350 [Dermatophilaceae bacterium]|nr:hypothetical protein [Dermatophilaceae bacterium]
MSTRSSTGYHLAIVGVVVLTVLSLLGHAGLLWLLSAPPTVATSRPGGTAITTAGAGASTASSTPSPPKPTTQGPAPAVPAYDAKTCLAPDNPATGAKLPAGDPFGDDMTDLGDKAELQRLYTVQAGRLVPADGLAGVRPCDQQLWDVVVATAPTLVPHIEELLVFDTDPKPQTGDYVIDGESRPKKLGPGSYDNSLWRLSFGPNGLSRDELAWLIAHELAHVLSLNSSQMLPGISRQHCATWYVGTGCPLKDSYFYRFFVNQWPDDIYDAWDTADSESDEAKRSAAYKKLYDSHKDSFVTAYAATHPLEDFAESFAMWCTYAPSEKERKMLPGGSAQSGGKVEWFTAATRDLVIEVGPGCEMLRQFAVL